MDLQAAFDEGFEAVRGYVDRSFASFEKRIAALEAREPLRGEKGEPGDAGSPGRDGMDGKDGANGLDVRDLFRAEGGRLVAVMSDGTTKDLGCIVGRDGADGKDGRDGMDGADGMGFDDMAIEYDGERKFSLIWSRGSVVKEAAFSIPAMIYRGVHADGRAYEAGDTVTWAGSLWVCREDGTDGKPDVSKGWTLAAKRGRDGREAKTADLHQPRVKI